MSLKGKSNGKGWRSLPCTNPLDFGVPSRRYDGCVISVVAWPSILATFSSLVPCVIASIAQHVRMRFAAFAAKEILRLRHDQRVLGIYRRLHVVGWVLTARSPHKPRLRLGILPQFLQRRLHRTRINGHFFLLVPVS
jgi:hypothetical protein